MSRPRKLPLDQLMDAWYRMNLEEQLHVFQRLEWSIDDAIRRAQAGEDKKEGGEPAAEKQNSAIRF